MALASRPLVRRAGPVLAAVAVLVVSGRGASPASAGVPGVLELPPALAGHDFSSTTLRPVSLGRDGVTAEPIASAGDPRTAADVVAEHVARGGGGGAVAFVVRRPGWGLCREEGAALTSLAATPEAAGFGFFGIIKEVNVDDAGLEEFSSGYYPGRDLYLDPGLDFYGLLGDRRLSLWTLLGLLANPVAAYRTVKDIGKRQAEKGIKQNNKGEGLLKGGVIVFDSRGKPRYAYLEETGDEIPADSLLEALKAVRSKDVSPEL